MHKSPQRNVDRCGLVNGIRGGKDFSPVSKEMDPAHIGRMEYVA